MSYWPQQQQSPPYSTPQSPGQNESPYLQTQFPPPPQQPPRPASSMLKTLNFFSAKPSYTPSPSTAEANNSNFPTFTTSSQGFPQPQTPWSPLPVPVQTLSREYNPYPPYQPTATTPTPLAPSPIQSPPPPHPPVAPYTPSNSWTEYDKLRIQLADLEVKLKDKTAECYGVQVNVSRLTQTLTERDHQIGKLQVEVEQLRQQINVASGNYKGGDAALQNLQRDIEDMRLREAGKDGELSRSRSEVEQSKVQIQGLQRELENFRLKENGNDGELLRLRSEVEQLKAQLEEVQRKSQEQIGVAQRAAQEQGSSAQANHRFAVEKAEEVTRITRELEEARKALQVNIGQLETSKRELEALRVEWAKKAGIEGEYQNLLQQVQHLRVELGNKDSLIASLKMQPQFPAPPVTPGFETWGQGSAVPPFAGSNGQTSSATAAQYVNPFEESPNENDASDQWWSNDNEAIKLSPSEAEWQRQKNDEGMGNEALETLMTKLSALENVKEHFLNIKAKIDTLGIQGLDLTQERFDLLLMGNPGTGKTQVAQIYATLMYTYLFCGYLKKPVKVVVKNGLELLSGESGGLDGVQKIFKSLKSGGIFLLDDVHHLAELKEGTSANSITLNLGVGLQILDYIMSEMQRNEGKIVFIFAGRGNLDEEHQGFSKIPSILRLKDYEDRELLGMLVKMIEEKYNGKMQAEGGLRGLYMRIAVRRIGRGRGRKNFGNARDIEKLFAQIRERQSARLNRLRRESGNVDYFLFTKEDLIGPNPTDVLKNSFAWKELQGFIGLEAVKHSVRSMVDMIQTNYQRELQEKPPMEVSLNRVFLGSPGTGKTSVAKLYGKILAELGLLSNGEVVVKNPADFLGNYLGQSENKTKAILTAAIGKVLVIDEAYMLYPNTAVGEETDIYKIAVIDTIVAEVQSTPGEDRCVLLLGYEDPIRNMFQRANPGLARRFAIENAFRFEDYTEPELRQILESKLRQQGLRASDAAKQVASEVLRRARMRPNFGNGGEVENIISQAKVRYQTRISRIHPSQRPVEVTFEPPDFDPEFARGATATVNCKKLFEDVIGCENVVAKLESYQRCAHNARFAGLELNDDIVPTCFIFKGPPGTGKTMTARKMGHVYYDMGFLASDKVTEVSASDMIGLHTGQTAPKTQKLFEKALGQVLFIDEAYRLREAGFGSEAINEMVDILTKPAYKGKIVVILAGYDNDMNELLETNRGLSSRFPEEIIFSNIPPAHCIELLARDLENKKITAPWLRDTSSTPYRKLFDLIVKLSSLASWGNARDIQTLGKTLRNIVFNSEKPSFVLDPGVGLRCVQQFLAEREARSHVVSSERKVVDAIIESSMSVSSGKRKTGSQAA